MSIDSFSPVLPSQTVHYEALKARQPRSSCSRDCACSAAAGKGGQTPTHKRWTGQHQKSDISYQIN